MQKVLDKETVWANEWAVKISTEKTKYVMFGYMRLILRVSAFKFLGVWFDEKMTRQTHVEKTVAKCEKVLIVMRCLAGAT